jgi:hypothetical protein
MFLVFKKFFCCLDADCVTTLEVSGDVGCGVELLMADAAHEDVVDWLGGDLGWWFLLHNLLFLLFFNLNFFRQLRLQFSVDLHDIRLHWG